MQQSPSGSTKLTSGGGPKETGRFLQHDSVIHEKENESESDMIIM